MKIEDFFEFCTKLSSTTIQAHATNLNIKKSGLDDHCKLIMGDYKGIEFPIIFQQEYGKKLEDVLGTGWANLYLISEKMRTILESNRLTGWKTFPIKLFDKNGNLIINYYGLSVIGRCGPIDYRKCEVIEKRLVATGPIGKYYKGLYIGLDLWDGTDFFLPQDTFSIIVSSKAAEALSKSKLSNIVLENLGEIETPSFALVAGKDLI